MQFTGERQVAPVLHGIRRDHLARYEWAAKLLPNRSRVVDFACGCGYGSQLMQDAGHFVTGYDKDPEAIDYARTFYGRAQYRIAEDECPLKKFDAAVCFETIEHIANPVKLLISLRGGSLLLASVPNNDVIPYGPGFAFHHRHYTRDQFRELLESTGWRVRQWYGQRGAESDVEPAVNGRTLIAVCDRSNLWRSEVPKDETPPESAPIVESVFNAEPKGIPEHVAILGLGPSLEQYVDLAKRLGGKHAFCDEVWGINAVAGVIMCDRVFHMDDVRIQEKRATADPASNIARMMEWLKFHPGPVYTSRAHPDYPGLVAFPLQDVLNKLGRTPYLNNTAAYALAYAIFLGVKRVSLFGCDYTYPNAHHAEKGRACLEYWLGVAAERGIMVTIPKSSTLMDACDAKEGASLYGYDTVRVSIKPEGDKLAVTFYEYEGPTAAEMESRYDHELHPNSIVSREEGKAS